MGLGNLRLRPEAPTRSSTTSLFSFRRSFPSNERVHLTPCSPGKGVACTGAVPVPPKLRAKPPLPPPFGSESRAKASEVGQSKGLHLQTLTRKTVDDGMLRPIPVPAFPNGRVFAKKKES